MQVGNESKWLGYSACADISQHPADGPAQPKLTRYLTKTQAGAHRSFRAQWFLGRSKLMWHFAVHVGIFLLLVLHVLWLLLLKDFQTGCCRHRWLRIFSFTMWLMCMSWTIKKNIIDNKGLFQGHDRGIIWSGHRRIIHLSTTYPTFDDRIHIYRRCCWPSQYRQTESNSLNKLVNWCLCCNAVTVWEEEHNIFMLIRPIIVTDS